jgi:hypothetical protein
MDESAKMVSVPAMQAERAKAIEVYSRLEYSLAMLVTVLLKTDHRNGFAIVTRIANARMCCRLVRDLIEQSEISECDKFWRSIEKRMSNLDDTRNHVVHWIQVSHDGPLSADGTISVETYSLVPWMGFVGNATETLKFEDLQMFIRSAQEVSSLISSLAGYALANPATRDAQRHIFCQPASEGTLTDLMEIIDELARGNVK